MKSAFLAITVILVLSFCSSATFAAPGDSTEDPILISYHHINDTPPNYGTVDGDIWTDTHTPPFLTGFSISVTPVPGTIMKGNEQLLTLLRGSVLSVSGTGAELEIWVITDFDYSDMGEHEMSGPIFSGVSYIFNEPGLYTACVKHGSSYSAAKVVEVK
jgi:hypothetical protein